MHDALLFYAKSADSGYTWNWPMEPKAAGAPKYKRRNVTSIPRRRRSRRTCSEARPARSLSQTRFKLRCLPLPPSARQRRMRRVSRGGEVRPWVRRERREGSVLGSPCSPPPSSAESVSSSPGARNRLPSSRVAPRPGAAGPTSKNWRMGGGAWEPRTPCRRRSRPEKRISKTPHSAAKRSAWTTNKRAAPAHYTGYISGERRAVAPVRAPPTGRRAAPLAGAPGFEPGITGSKPVALPLGYAPSGPV